MRLFLAVSPDPSARAQIERVHAMLARSLADAAAALRWVNSSVAHLTVHFLGEIDPALVAALISALDGSVPVGPFDLSLSGLEASPRSGPPRVVWIPVATGAEPLAAVHRTLAERITSVGIALEARPFTPHLTIARVRDQERRHLRSLGARLREFRCNPIAWRVDHVTLFRSDLSGGMPKYESLHTIALDPRR